MARLAWFTPLAPLKSGISRYSRELMPELARSHDSDVFVDGKPAAFVAPDARVRLFAAHDFICNNRSDPYDLIVYHLGNAPYHDYMWAYLIRHPGLVVLHDGQLHHARARLLLQQKRYDDYRQEFWFNHPDAHVDLPELGVQGLLGSLTYCWPMLRTVVESSRMIVVHNNWLADQIRQAHPQARVQVVEMGVPEPAPQHDGREAIRTRHRIPANAVLFVALGKVTPEKRIGEALRALTGIREAVPHVHLLLAGEKVDYYDPVDEAKALGIENKVTVAGYVADAEIDDYIAAADVCLCTRWPTSRETSASWLRCLAAGRPTVTTDLVHNGDVPTFDARNGSVLGTGDPIGVSVDILDEKHSLASAMRALTQDAGLRNTLGTNARKLWNSRFRLEMMVESYRKVIDLAVTAPSPSAQTRAALPTHLLADGTEHAAGLLRDAGFPDDVISAARLTTFA
jgi:glycosyltransferase involved in cell wall biosynthesis